ncbi:MAG: antibiotic biosynthesis monooxygenase [Planctomycetaceae bacterium]|nr:antibiotic biosynthesis monooxygenase [Planctomycetaceae bacterium]
MFVYIVHVHVKPEFTEQFKEASVKNAMNTVKEPGNYRYDVLQQPDDPARFVFYEVYSDETALDFHKQSAHFSEWKTAVLPWLAEPFHAVKYSDVFYTET